MSLYKSHGLTLEIELPVTDQTPHFEQLLEDLSWVRCNAATSNPSLTLRVGFNDRQVEIPTDSCELFRADDFSAAEASGDFYLNDGCSIFHCQPASCEGDISLSPAFFQKPILVQRNFWAFALLKLLRNLNIFTLHAAGVTHGGVGVVIVGSPGSGKSTLALGLIRLGWGYLSDDALLLRDSAEAIEALAFRKKFYVNADAIENHADLPLGDTLPDSYGGTKRAVQIEQVYPAQYVKRCKPTVLLFSQIVNDTQSVLLPCDRITTLKNLLAQSGWQLFDRRTIDKQLELLTRLVRQSTSYELKAGLDLYQKPAILMRLLADCDSDRSWLD